LESLARGPRRLSFTCYFVWVETLHPIEVRVLGALLEKELTTPEYYPLTLNALLNACNQKSSREPIVHYDEDTVNQALELLRNKGLVVKVSGAGHRVEKFGHRLGETFNLGRRESALLCVLMLRGPQTVGELRGRTERMHDFAEMDEVERVLDTLAEHEPPFVTRMARGRWGQLLGGAPEADQAPAVHAAAVSQPVSQLETRVEVLEQEVADLKQKLESLIRQFQ